MLGVLLPQLFVYCSSAFCDNAQRFGYLLLETAIMELTIMSFVRLIQATEYGVAKLFMPARRWTLIENGRLCANEGVSVPLPSKIRANILKRGITRVLNDCAVDLIAAILAFPRAGEIDRKAPNNVACFLYGIAKAVMFSAPEWEAKSLKWCLCGDALTLGR